MRVLVTRPQPDADRTAEKIRARGHEAIVAPLFEIELKDVPSLDEPGPLVVTSANAARALAKASKIDRHRTVYAVGARSAKATEAAGFDMVVAGDGTADALAARIIADAPDHVAYLSGAHVSTDLKALLEPHGVKVTRHVVYEAHPLDAFDASTLEALERGTIDCVLFYSVRAAAHFGTLVEAASLSDRMSATGAAAMSDKVAAALSERGFERIYVAERPDEEALFEAARIVPEGKGDCVTNEPGTIEGEAEHVRISDEQPAAPPRRRGFGLFAWLLLAMLVIFGLGVWAAPWISEQAGGRLPWLFAEREVETDPDVLARLAALESENVSLRQRIADVRTADDQGADMAALRAEIERVKSDIAAQPAPSDLPAEIAAQLDAFENRLDRFEEVSAAAAETGTRLDALELRLRSLEAASGVDPRQSARLDELAREIESLRAALDELRDIARTGDQTAAATLALRALGRAIESGRPFAAEVEEVRAQTETLDLGSARDTMFAALMAHADEGVATRATLERRLKRNLTDWVSAAKTPREGGWFERVRARLASIVTVRRVDDPTGDAPAARLTRAELALAQGDLETAIEEVEALPANARQAAAEWLTDARARMAAEAAYEELVTALAERG